MRGDANCNLFDLVSDFAIVDAFFPPLLEANTPEIFMSNHKL